MDYLTMLRYRKSVRAFAGGQIAAAELEAILAAASCAPVGSNMYKDVHLTVVQDRAVLDRLSEAAVQRWEDKARVREIVGDLPAAQLNRRLQDPFYGAPTVIFVSHRKQAVQPGIEFANTACITLAMHLAALQLGLGSVFMWFALESMREIPALDHSADLCLPQGFEPLLGLAIGRPAQALVEREAKAGKIRVNYL